MKNLTFKRSKLGFTLAELLLVIAILAVLVGLGVTGFVALRQNIIIAKYDDLAREIYVAAQNQLTRLEANGIDANTLTMLQGTAITEKPSDYADSNKPWDGVKDNFRYAEKSSQPMTVLLPLGAVADDVRSDGYYVIEYNVQTRTVYSVFYSAESFNYGEVAKTPNFRTSRSVRKGPMVGYYGGSAVERDPQTHCPTPKLEIINNNELRLNILEVPLDVTGVSVKISDGEKEVTVSTDKVEYTGENARTVLLDSMENDKHFHQLFSDLKPGSDLTITVTYEKPGSISSSASITANSLFATREKGGENGDTVTLAWARHLQNLEKTVSNLDDSTITTARQTEHIQWVENLEFVSINNKDLLRFEGSRLEIRDLKGSNGLFAQTKEGMTLSAIRLVNPAITAETGSTSPVGALVGTAAPDTTIEWCGVYANKVNGNQINYDAYKDCFVKGGNNAITGGLVGQATNVTVKSSFAALPSLSGQSGASLIGSAANCEIKNSYANCDNLQPGFHYFVSGEGNTIDHCYAVGNVENAEKGIFAKTNNTVTDSYYAVSHREFAEQWENNKDLAATEFCYIGETGDWQMTNEEGMRNATQPGGWAADWQKMIAPLSHPYREYLEGRAFPYPAIGELDHYGSWPDGDGTVTLTIDMTLLNNKNAGYANFAGTVIVTDDKDKELFNSEDYDGTNNVVQVAPGTKVTIKITPNDGYAYVRTTIDGTQVSSTGTAPITVTHTVNKDTKAEVIFRQKAFQLTGTQAVDENGNIIGDASYFIDLTSPKKTLNVAGSDVKEEKVETGSTVTVRPWETKSSVVWYTVNGKTVYVNKDQDGNYTFPMPAGNTEVHVMYTEKTVTFNLEYYLMDTNGEYKLTETPTKVYEVGLGSQINQDMIDALAEGSGLPLVIDGERVRYLAEAFVFDKSDNEVFHSVLNADGVITKPGTNHITDENESQYTVKIYIARKMYTVTLEADTNVEGVRFGDTAGDYQPTVTKPYYYGASVTALAEVAPGYSFTFWDPKDTRFMMSADQEYTFQVPHFDLHLYAIAATDRYLVTINLLENDESWLFGDPSRQADPIKLTLVSTVDGREYPMEALERDDISYAMQAVVPSIMTYGHGYEVRVNYANSNLETWLHDSEYAEDAEEAARTLIYVRDHAVEHTAKFYSVTYHPTVQNYQGTVPQGGTYPMYYRLTVQGNTGLLRYTNEDGQPQIFSGWKDYYADGTGTPKTYGGGEILTVTRRTDMFAQWKHDWTVIYHDNDADGGELPVDTSHYQSGSEVKIKLGSLTRKGYKFVGWSKTENNGSADFTTDGQTYQLAAEDLDGNGKFHLYPVWKLETYTVEFYDTTGNLLGDKTLTGKHYNDRITAPTLIVPGKNFVGWALEPGGDIVCQPSGTYTVTGNTKLYACTADQYIQVIYKSADGNTTYDTVNFGKDIPGYLTYVPTIDGELTPVTAWSTEPNGKGTLYPCDESGRSEQAYSFPDNIILYAVTGRVYNYNKQLWFKTLGEAARDGRTQDWDTLIVYRNTDEPSNIWFTKSLYVLAHGNRTVKWVENATAWNDENNILNKQTSGELVGCMSVSSVTIEFGRSNIPTLSMEDSTLTFDANKQSRVISLGNGATFHMYDGITLTNGFRASEFLLSHYQGVSGRDTPASRTAMGGGLYASGGAKFYMHGGTISYCEAISGGGVYLYIGSKMYMGDMVQPTAYSATAIYYDKIYNEELQENIYINTSGVTPETYNRFYIAAGNPQICYNFSWQKKDGLGDGGGGLMMVDLNNGDLTLFRGSITNNESTANGGGIMTDCGHNDDFLRIYEVDISHNTAGGNGGGIFQWQGTVYVYNSTIRQNKAGGNGGGIYLRNGGVGGVGYNIEFYFGDISDNEAVGNGGGVYGEASAIFYLRGGNLCRNKATDGGGIYFVSEPGTISLEGGTVSGNTASRNGGGILSAGNLLISGGVLSDNRAENNGSGAYCNRTSKVTMTGGTVCNNSAKYLGGGFWVEGSFKLSGGALYGNTDTDHETPLADEDSENSSPNDIYLCRDKVITIPKEVSYLSEEGKLDTKPNNDGIKLSGEQRVYVDCENDDSQRFSWTNDRYRFAVYEDTNQFEPDDALYFAYHGTRSTDYSINTLKKNNLSVFTHAQLTDNPAVGLYFAEERSENNHSYVAFDLNYPDCAEPISKQYTVGHTLDLSRETDHNLTRTGYYLAGWARTPDALEEEYELFYDVVEDQWKTGFDPKTGKWTNVEKNKPIYTVKDLAKQTLYAMWRPCVVVYDLDVGKGHAEIQPTSVGPRVTILNPSPMKFTAGGKDYYFDHWVDEKDDTKVYSPMDQLELEKNIRLKAVWNERVQDTFIITFYFNDGTSDKTGELCRQVAVKKNESHKIDVQLHRANKILTGWNTERDGTGTPYAPDGTISGIEDDMKLYAQWADAVTLTYDVNGGTGNSTVQSYVKGTEVTIKGPETTKKGYQFLGWSTDPRNTAAQYEDGAKITLKENTTLYAVWEKLPTWKVTFDLDGGNSNSAFDPKEVLQSVGSFTIPDTEPSKDNCSFAYWIDGDGVQYNRGNVVTLKGDLTLTAVWKCTVFFDLNDGTGTSFGNMEYVLNGSDFTIPAEKPTRTGYVFKGWAEKADATEAQYKPESKVSITQNTILYAVWTDHVKVEFDLSGGRWPRYPAYDQPESLLVGSEFRLPECYKGYWTDQKTVSSWTITYSDGSSSTARPNEKIIIQAQETVTFTAVFN